MTVLADMEAVEQSRSVRVMSISTLKGTFFGSSVGLCHRLYACLIDVIKQLRELLISSSDRPCYAGSPNTIRVPENRPKDIKPPHLITRILRPLAEINYWKSLRVASMASVLLLANPKWGASTTPSDTQAFWCLYYYWIRTSPLKT